MFVLSRTDLCRVRKTYIKATRSGVLWAFARMTLLCRPTAVIRLRRRTKKVGRREERIVVETRGARTRYGGGSVVPH